MPLQVKCAECGSDSEVGDELAGQIYACACGADVPVPKSSAGWSSAGHAAVEPDEGLIDADDIASALEQSAEELRAAAPADARPSSGEIRAAGFPTLDESGEMQAAGFPSLTESQELAAASAAGFPALDESGELRAAGFPSLTESQELAAAAAAGFPPASGSGAVPAAGFPGLTESQELAAASAAGFPPATGSSGMVPAVDPAGSSTKTIKADGVDVPVAISVGPGATEGTHAIACPACSASLEVEIERAGELVACQCLRLIAIPPFDGPLPPWAIARPGLSASDAELEAVGVAVEGADLDSEDADAPAPEPLAAVTPGDAPAPAPASEIAVECRECRRTFTVHRRLGGQTIRCECDAPVSVPLAPMAALSERMSLAADGGVKTGDVSALAAREAVHVDEDAPGVTEEEIRRPSSSANVAVGDGSSGARRAAGSSGAVRRPSSGRAARARAHGTSRELRAAIDAAVSSSGTREAAQVRRDSSSSMRAARRSSDSLSIRVASERRDNNRRALVAFAVAAILGGLGYMGYTLRPWESEPAGPAAARRPAPRAPNDPRTDGPPPVGPSARPTSAPSPLAPRRATGDGAAPEPQVDIEAVADGDRRYHWVRWASLRIGARDPQLALRVLDRARREALFWVWLDRLQSRGRSGTIDLHVVSESGAGSSSVRLAMLDPGRGTPLFAGSETVDGIDVAAIDALLRRALVEAVRAEGDAAADLIAMFGRLLSSGAEGERVMAARGLGAVGAGDEKAARLLREAALGDPIPAVREAAAIALDRATGDPATSVRLLVGAQPERLPDRRCAALEALRWYAKYPTVVSAPLVKGLGDEHRLVRRTAAETLAILGPEAARGAAALREAVANDQYPEVRAAAAATLGAIGSRIDDESIAVLIAALGDASAPVREAASDALARIGGRALPALIAVVTGEDEPTKRRFAVDAVGRLGPVAEEATPELARAARAAVAARDVVLVERIALAAVRIGRVGVGELVMGLEETKPYVRDAIARAQAACDRVSEGAPPPGEPALRAATRPLVRVLFGAEEASGAEQTGGPDPVGSGPKGGGRGAAPAARARALRALPAPERQAALDALIAEIDGTSEDAAAAVAVLDALGPDGAAAAHRLSRLVDERSVTDPAAPLGIAAAGALLVMGEPADAALDEVIEGTSAGRAVLCRALARAGDPRALHGVRRALEAQDELVQLRAALALQRLGEPLDEAVAANVTRALAPNRAEPERAVAALQVLAAMGPAAQAHIEDVVAMLGDERAEVRRAAIDAVPAIAPDGAAAVGALARTLSSTDATASEAACRLLERFGAAAGPALAELSKIESSPDYFLRAAAIDAARAAER